MELGRRLGRVRVDRQDGSEELAAMVAPASEDAVVPRPAVRAGGRDEDEARRGAATATA